jgi:hypothetical protein
MSGTEPEHQKHRKQQIPRILSALIGAIMFTSSVLIGGCATTRDVRASQRSPIAVESVHLSAAGHFVDLRYRVLDAERAQAALGPKVRPRLIDEATGAVMAVPTTAKLGSLRQTQGAQKPGRMYFVLFVNRGMREGSLVTAELGELRFEHLRIE